MVKQATIEKTISLLKLIQQSGLTINAYFKSLDKSPYGLYNTISRIKKENNQEEVEDVILLYNSIKHREDLIEKFEDKQLTLNFNENEEVTDKEISEEEINEEEILDTDDKIESSILRNKEGKISGYKFKVYRRDNTPVQGVLTRTEMQLIYRLYSYYGASITQREISRHFPDYSLVDFKRILRAFNITKASGPFAPHMYEEKTEEELKEIHLREKENDFLKKIEKDELKDLQNTTTKLARRNKELEDKIQELSKGINITFTNKELTANPVHYEDSDVSMIVHLADMHVGAKCESYTLYDNPYNDVEIERRLEGLVDCIYSYGHLDTLIINILGDSLDGMDNQTARRDHYMPQEMDNMQQLETFINLTFNFISQCRYIANKVKVYCVKCGNHGGMWEYTANLALKNAVEKAFPDVEFTLFTNFIGSYEFKGHTYLICHGKDEKFMKKAFPLNLDEKTKVIIQEWLTNNNLISKKNIHFIKGDLHSNALSSCKLFDYRHTLSLFGSSDYANYNFSQNSYGASYDLFIDNNRSTGVFENL